MPGGMRIHENDAHRRVYDDTDLIFTNDELNNKIEKACIRKCGGPRLVGNYTLKRALTAAK
jgi:hypothetical protein